MYLLKKYSGEASEKNECVYAVEELMYIKDKLVRKVLAVEGVIKMCIKKITVHS